MGIRGRLLAGSLAVVITLGGCSSTETVDTAREPEPVEGAAASTTSTDASTSTPDETEPFVDDPATDVDEANAYETLVALMDSLAAGDYEAAVDLVMEDGISEAIVEQVGLTEDQAFTPGRMEAALARYCQATDCTAGYRIVRLVESEFLTAVFEVEVDLPGDDGEPLTTAVSVGAFEGQYHVNNLPFGSPVLPPGGDEMSGTADGVPFYTGFDSPEGWRLAPVTETGMLVTYWNRDGYRVTGHSGLASLDPLSSNGIGAISTLEAGYGSVYLQREGDEQTIWRDDGDGDLTPVVTVPEPQRITLEGAHPRDLDDVDLFYQIHFPGSPSDDVDKLFRHNPESGAVTEIVETGGWESGTEFFDLEGAYPLALAIRYAEASTWFEVLDLDTGASHSIGSDDGDVCTDGEAGCVVYEVAILSDGDIVGMRGDAGADSSVVGSMVLARFDPATGEEQVIARFEWDNGLWYPHGIMIGGAGVIVSVGDFEANTAYPAVTIDLTTGHAETLKIAGFARPAYLS